MNHFQDIRKDERVRSFLKLMGILIVLTMLIGLLRSCEKRQQEKDKTKFAGIIYDENAVKGGWSLVDTEKIIASLNEKVEEGMINISMNTTPYFANGSAAGNLMIVNESINRYPQVVEITRNDTGGLIYQSGAIPVGSKIEKARLAEKLGAGSYECTAMFYNVDPETGARLGCAGAVINIKILK